MRYSIKEEDTKITFGELKEGDWFEYNGYAHLKIPYISGNGGPQYSVNAIKFHENGTIENECYQDNLGEEERNYINRIRPKNIEFIRG